MYTTNKTLTAAYKILLLGKLIIKNIDILYERMYSQFYIYNFIYNTVNTYIKQQMKVLCWTSRWVLLLSVAFAVAVKDFRDCKLQTCVKQY